MRARAFYTLQLNPHIGNCGLRASRLKYDQISNTIHVYIQELVRKTKDERLKIRSDTGSHWSSLLLEPLETKFSTKTKSMNSLIRICEKCYIC